jgi:hypothetical protein
MKTSSLSTPDRELSLFARALKLGEFLRAPALGTFALHPNPWAEAAHPYHVVKRLRNPDGHGGYTETNCIDEAGVPYRQTASGKVYHPLVLARYAMKMQAIAADTGDSGAARKATNVLPALLDSGRRTGAWHAGSSIEAMASETAYANVQGGVISALLRLCDGRPDGEIRDLIERASRRLMARVEEGGTVAPLDGGPFLQEAPGTSLRHILNGCVDGVFALYDLSDRLSDAAAKRLASDTVRTIIRTIGKFISPRGWSYYALDAFGRPYVASIYYHGSHVLRIRVLAMRTGEEALDRAAAIWERSLLSAGSRLMAAATKTAQVIWMRDILRRRLDVCP